MKQFCTHCLAVSVNSFTYVRIYAGYITSANEGVLVAVCVRRISQKCYVFW